MCYFCLDTKFGTLVFIQDVSLTYGKDVFSKEVFQFIVFFIVLADTSVFNFLI